MSVTGSFRPGRCRVLRGILPILTSLIVLGLTTSGCDQMKDMQDQVSGVKTIKLVVHGTNQTSVTIPAPVMFQGIRIGQAVNKGIDDNHSLYLDVEIESEHVSHLKDAAVFYLESTYNQTSVVYEIIHEQSPDKGEPFVFLCFRSKLSFWAWRARNLISKSAQEAIQALKDALRDPTL